LQTSKQAIGDVKDKKKKGRRKGEAEEEEGG
jgi:hypothetical protein